MGELTVLRHGRARGVILLLSVAGAAAAAAPATSSALAATQTAGTRAIPPGFQNWSEHGGDALHSGVSSETSLSTATTYALHWTASAGAKSYSSPAVVFNARLNKSLVYVGNMSGALTAFDATTGAQVWQYRTVKVAGLSKEIESSPAVSHNTVYFGDGDYHEYALNATTGALICKSQSAGGIIASSAVIGNPAGTGDVVYYGDGGPNGEQSDGGHLWAMYGVGNTAGPACGSYWTNDNFGSPPGSQTGLSGVYSTPAYGHLADNTPIVTVGTTDSDDAIYAFNATTGVILWRFQTLVGIDSDVGAPPTIAEPGTIGAVGSASFTDGVLYDTGKDGQTYALDLLTGAQIWTFNIKKTIHHGNPAQSGAALVGNAIYLGYGAGVFSLNATTGALNWTSPVAAPVVSSVSVAGPAGSQVIFVGDINGGADVFSLATGAPLFSFNTGGLIFSSAAVSTGQFFIANSSGNLYAFGQ